MGSLRGTTVKGARVQFPYDLWIPTTTSAADEAGAALIDASGEYVDFQFEAEDAKAIASAMVRFGTITAGDAATPFSLTNVDDTAQPSRPGATTHASGTIDTTTAGYANTARLCTFGATYTPTKGQLLAFKFGWAGAQNLQLLTNIGKGAIGFPFVHTFLGAAHGANTAYPLFGIKYSDGTWMRIPWAFPSSNIATVAYGSGSASNEYGMRMVLPFSMMVDTISIFHDADAADQFKLSIRDANRVSLASKTIEGDTSASVTWGPKAYRLDTPVHMRAGKVYFVTKEATAAGTVDVQTLAAYDAQAMDAFLGNADCYQVNRTTTADPAFTESTTTKVMIGVEGYALSR